MVFLALTKRQGEEMLIQLLGKKTEDAVLDSKTATENGVYSASDYNVDGFNVFTVAVPEPSGTLNIDENGIKDVKDYARVDVNVSAATPVIQSLSVTPDVYPQAYPIGSGIDGYGPVNVAAVTSAIDSNIAAENIRNGVTILGVTGNYDGESGHYLDRNVVNGKLVYTTNFINLTGVTDIGDNALAHAYRGMTFPQNTIADLSMLTQISGAFALSYAFAGGTGFSSADLSSVVTISGYYACEGMFNACQVASADFSSLEAITGSYACDVLFAYNTYVINVSFPSLHTISASALNRCLVGCGNLESLSFGGVRPSTFASNLGALASIFDSGTGSTAPNGCIVHFPSNFDPTDPDHDFDLSTLTGYPTFGGDSAYIHLAFDLPPTSD